jgi:hypothetical protein
VLVAVKVTVVVPPQAGGGVGLPLDSTVLQPPVAEASPNHALNALLMAACDWQAATVVLAGTFRDTTGAAVTVNVRVQVTGIWQSLVAVKVTVAVPKQAFGAPVLLLESTVPQPPETLAEANQAA